MFTELQDESFYDNFFIDDWEVESNSYDDVPDNVLNAAADLFELLSQLIAVDDFDGLEEQFASTKKAYIWQHFIKHCIGNQKNYISKRSGVRYDFIDISDYISREDQMDKLSSSSTYIIKDLVDLKTVDKCFRKLFEGNITINITTSCGLSNSYGRVALAIHSWATDVTNNYLHNTVDFLIRTPDNKTITMYAVDANYLESKVNSIFVKNNLPKIKFNR